VVFDVSNGASPQRVGLEPLLGNPRAIVKWGDLAYVAAGWYGVHVVDVSDPANPEWIEGISVGKKVEEVSIGGGLLIVTCSTGEVKLYALSVPSGSELVGEIASSGEMRCEAAVFGDRLFVVEAGGVVDEYNIETPQTPTFVTTHDDDEVLFSGKFDQDMMFSMNDECIPTAGVSLYRFDDAPDVIIPDPPDPPKNILFVGNGGYSKEDALLSHLQGRGFIVEVKKDYQISTSVDLSSYDLIVLTGYAPNVSSSGVSHIENSGKPIFVLEYWDFIYSAQLDLVDDEWSGTTYDDTIELTTYTHVITESLGYNEVVYTTNGVLLGTPMYSIEPGITPLIYSTSTYNQAALIVDDVRGIVASGIHETLSYNAVGWEILDRSFDYLLAGGF
jgi:LVIVD repeat